jgi:hypothetical protein
MSKDMVRTGAPMKEGGTLVRNVLKVSVGKQTEKTRKWLIEQFNEGKTVNYVKLLLPTTRRHTHTSVSLAAMSPMQPRFICGMDHPPAKIMFVLHALKPITLSTMHYSLRSPYNKHTNNAHCRL